MKHPFGFVPLPQKVARHATQDRTHERLRLDHHSGRLSVELVNQTRMLVARGMDADGNPLDQNADKTWQTRGADECPVIPGSSLKGMLRAAFEAVTDSCLLLLSKGYKDKDGNVIPKPPGKVPRACAEGASLCPACALFGTVAGKRARVPTWKGRVSLSDAVLVEAKPARREVLPKLLQPRPKSRPGSTTYVDYYPDDKMAGRKFYRRKEPTIVQPIQQRRGPISQASHKSGKGSRHQATGTGPRMGCPLPEGSVFRFDLLYRDLTTAELGALLWVLLLPEGACHAVGTAKNHGWGRIQLRLTAWEQLQPEARYRGGTGITHLATPAVQAEAARFLAQDQLINKGAYAALIALASGRLPGDPAP